MTREQKLERWAEREIKRNANNLILDDHHGRVLAFGTWEIDRVEGAVRVAGDGEQRDFSDSRSAISWCVARKFQQHHLQLEIEQKDADRLRLLTDIKHKQRLARQSKDPYYSELLLTKLQGKRYRLFCVERDLRKYTNQAKYLQLRGFSK